MRKFYKLNLTLIIVLASTTSLFAQNSFFSDQGANRTMPTSGQRIIKPNNFRTFSADIIQLKNFLWSLPAEATINSNRNQAPVMSLPMPDGSMARFRVWESSIMEPGLAAKFPEMRQFLGQGIDDPYATIRFDYNPYTGFHGQILSSAKGRVYIDPYANGDLNNYVSYFTKDYTRDVNFICEVVDNGIQQNRTNQTEALCLGTSLRTYRLALACTGEYAVAVCSPNPPSVPLTAAAMLTSVNRVTGVYEVEVSLRMVLVSNNNLLIYLDGTTDPYTNNNGNTMLGQNQANVDAVIGNANYDIGHVFSTGGGGVANLNSPCNAGLKARGVTGLGFPVGDNFDIDYVAHEMGHQWGGNHSMAGCGSSPASTKYEVGSGTSIQGYAGICGSQDIQPHSDPHFHAISFDEISNYISSGGGSVCAVSTPTGNTLPVIDPLPNNNLSIPPSTPFTLSGTASDANSDPLTYCWEQWDLQGTQTWNAGATAPPGNTVPLFKSRIPKTNGVRTFPDISVILAGYPANPPAQMGGLKGETLSPVTRNMNFRLTVRDNRAGGGGVTSSGGGGCQSSTPFTVIVAGSTPFTVSVPNGGESYPGGTTQTVTWNNAGTTAAPFNVANVMISLSTDGGLTYPTVIVASTPNDGSESVTIPVVTPTSTARVKVEAIGNIFFDISNNNFSITAAPGGFTFNSPGPVTATCPAANPMTATLTATYNGTFSNNITLSSTVVPAGPTVTFGTNPLTIGTPSTTVNITNANSLAPGNYTVTVQGVASGAATQTRDIVFTINPGAGPAITTHPAPQSICNGDNTSFTVVSPTATAFKWQVNTGAGFVDIINGGVYGGATTATLTLTNVPASFNGYLYRAVPSVFCGSTNSNSALLTVNSAAAITNHPQDITLCAGSTHTFTVTATGSGLTYQWQESTDGGTIYNNLSNGGIYSGVLSANLTLTGITAGMNNYKYKVVVTGTGACPAPVTSNPATLTVVSSVTVTSQPTSQTICAGGNASFTVAGSGTGVIYQWQENTGSGFVNVVNGGVYGGATTNTLTITGGTVSMNGYQYRAQLSNSTCPSPGISDVATLTVNSLPAITSQPANSTICLGGNTSFTSTGSGTGLTYQWQVNPGSGFVDVANGGVYSGATTSTLTITGATASMNNYVYHVVVSGTCPPSATSSNATLTVVNPVSISAQPATQAVLCSGSNTSFSVTAVSTETVTYQWQVSTDGGGSWSNVTNSGVYSGANTATLTITGATVAMNSYRYRVLLTNVSCTTATISGQSLLIVRALPTVGLSASMTSLLPGQLSTLTATPSAPAVGGTQTITWLYNGVPAVPPITGNTYIANVEQVGTYQVLIQEAYTGPTLVCSNQSPVITITATASSRLFIFPSPNDGRFTVSYFNNGGVSTQRNIVIYDSKGSQIYKRKFPIAGLYTLINIDLRTASRGIYYVVVGDVNGQKLADGKVHIR